MREKNLKGKKVAVLVEDLYQDLEVWYPLLRLREAGADPFTVGTGSKKTYKSKHGYEITVDKSISEVSANEVSGVVIPGGYAPDILRRYDEVNEFVAEAFKNGAVISCICHGAWVLCSAKILAGRTVTCFSAIKDDVIHAGAKYVDEEVVVDGNLVTSRKPEDLPAFMRETLKLLNGK